MRFPIRSNRLISLAGAIAFSVTATSCQAAPTPPAQAPTTQDATGAQWKTAYYKRGFVGTYQAEWANGINSTLRVRVFLPLDGTQVRVTLGSMRQGETELSRLSLARGTDEAGTISGAPIAFQFGGTSGVKIAANQAEVVSDATASPLKSGVWYLQQSYASEKYLYAYSVDGFFSEASDNHATPLLAQFKGGTWPGNVQRIEVLTKDTRPIIACYGDSITHGYNSTPNAGQSYPEILGRLTKLPTLNFGVNGDLITYAGGAPSLINSCNGVKSVIVLMGINDIITGRIKTPEEYSKIASNLIKNLKQNERKVYIGTILPAGGYADFDKDPAKETLRQGINAWISKDSGADAVIDFAAALADPQDAAKMKTEYQSDHLHPNDAGYQKMAEVAAEVLKTHP